MCWSKKVRYSSLTNIKFHQMKMEPYAVKEALKLGWFFNSDLNPTFSFCHGKHARFSLPLLPVLHWTISSSVSTRLPTGGMWALLLHAGLSFSRLSVGNVFKRKKRNTRYPRRGGQRVDGAAMGGSCWLLCPIVPQHKHNHATHWPLTSDPSVVIGTHMNGTTGYEKHTRIVLRTWSCSLLGYVIGAH